MVRIECPNRECRRCEASARDEGPPPPQKSERLRHKARVGGGSPRFKLENNQCAKLRFFWRLEMKDHVYSFF